MRGLVSPRDDAIFNEKLLEIANGVNPDDLEDDEDDSKPRAGGIKRS